MNTFSNTAMLVSLNVRQFSAKREDRKISEDVERQHNAKDGAGKYSKNLIPKKHLEPITKAATALRAFHYENSLPWLDSGVRVLPSANYQEYKTRVQELREAFELAVAAFAADWPNIVEDARKSLGGMFDAADYPNDVRAKYGVQVRFMPVSDPSDFRVNVGDAERLRLQAEIAETMKAAQDAAMAELWTRVSECVSHMAERLRAFKVVNGKNENTFRDTLVSNLQDLVNLIPRLNFAGDARLESIRQEIAAELLRVSAAELRDDYRVRDDVARKAEEIAARVSEFMA